MSDIENGGVIRFEVETQHEAWHMFDTVSENGGLDRVIAKAVNAGAELIEATTAGRQYLMSAALAIAAKIPHELCVKFEETDPWWEFVDDQIALRDHAVATMPEGTE